MQYHRDTGEFYFSESKGNDKKRKKLSKKEKKKCKKEEKKLVKCLKSKIYVADPYALSLDHIIVTKYKKSKEYKKMIDKELDEIKEVIISDYKNSSEYLNKLEKMLVTFNDSKEGRKSIDKKYDSIYTHEAKAIIAEHKDRMEAITSGMNELISINHEMTKMMYNSCIANSGISGQISEELYAAVNVKVMRQPSPPPTESDGNLNFRSESWDDDLFKQWTDNPFFNPNVFIVPDHDIGGRYDGLDPLVNEVWYPPTGDYSGEIKTRKINYYQNDNPRRPFDFLNTPGFNNFYSRQAR